MEEVKHSILNTKTGEIRKVADTFGFCTARKKFYIPTEEDFRNFVEQEYDFLVELKIQDLTYFDFKLAVKGAQDARFNNRLNEYYFHYIGPKNYQEIKDELLEVPERRLFAAKFFEEYPELKKN